MNQSDFLIEARLRVNRGTAEDVKHMLMEFARLVPPPDRTEALRMMDTKLAALTSALRRLGNLDSRK
ncbi:MAG: hypothetical protein LBT26_09430 [Clostridiales Family XIII bacterium]|nr:hypothetical protein [Clostridiales Family XIII bacterium]